MKTLKPHSKFKKAKNELSLTLVVPPSCIVRINRLSKQEREDSQKCIKNPTTTETN